MTKRAESLDTLRALSPAQLDDHLRGQRRKLFELRFQQATGQVEDHREIRRLHKEIARAMTVQIEARLAGREEG